MTVSELILSLRALPGECDVFLSIEGQHGKISPVRDAAIVGVKTIKTGREYEMCDESEVDGPSTFFGVMIAPEWHDA